MGKRNRHAKPKQTRDTQNSQPLEFAVGDSIIVKPGVKDPDTGGNIGGLQGRITEIESDPPHKTLITFKWDSISLKSLRPSAIRRCEENGLDWTTMCLYAEEIEPAKPRDTQNDVDAVVEELEAEHAWDYLGKQGQRIHQVLREVDEDDDIEAFEAWEEYLKKHLKLPFEAEVSELQERGPLRAGDRVRVLAFAGVADLYGVLVNIKAGPMTNVFPLCDLKAVQRKTTNFELTDDYAVWYANR